MQNTAIIKKLLNPLSNYINIEKTGHSYIKMLGFSNIGGDCREREASDG